MNNFSPGGQARLPNLDYLRGLAAFGIMIYHYLTSISGKFSADTLMGRVGIYGVSIFYVLSGLTLYYVYYDKMKPSSQDLISFFKKRILRIFPLLWLVTITAIILSRKMPDMTDLLLNLSGLFGFVKWDTYFSVGAWSIGNELVFYMFFPFFILCVKQFKKLMMLTVLSIFGLYLYFAFSKLNPGLTLSEQWNIYTNPLNQVFLFLGGFLIGLFFHNLKIKNSVVIALLVFGLATVTFYPVAGDTIHIVTGVNRLIFTACCFLICICFYKLSLNLPRFIHKPLTLLGEASYSVYLLHPIVWTITGISWGIFHRNIIPISKMVIFPFSVLLTLVISYYCYHYFEKFFMKFGSANKQNGR